MSHDEWAAYRRCLAEHRETERQNQAAARDRLAGVRRSG